MKQAESDKPIHTIPNGVWESSRPYKKKPKAKDEHLNEITTDTQGNGYPVSNNSRQDK